MLFLSLGAGVQSSVMLMLAIRGDIERPDHVIFADTGFEPRAVYQHVKWCQRQCEKEGIPIHIVKAKRDLREDFHAMESGKKYNWGCRPPIYMNGGNKRKGISLRQCTRDVKIHPIERKQIELMGHKTARTATGGESITMIGISTDEARRASPSKTRWNDIIYPLIDPKKMSRQDCQSWWEHHYPNINLPSSSCTICPYRSNSMWRQMKKDAPADWEEAVEYDERIRATYLTAKNAAGDRKPQTVYLHKSYTPLKDADLGESQMGFDLEDEIYCAGGCGL